jgi:ferrous iron transport protein A
VHRRRRATGLAASDIGACVRLTGVGLTGADLLRLAEFGLRAGAVLTVLGRTAGGGRLVSLGTSRFVVDERTAHGLAVEAAQ